ncbi:MAG: Bug family tripartite tricarboxylate transporter substrate binding protein [Burkholderiales bacterium]
MALSCSIVNIFSLAACACATFLPAAAFAQTATPPYPVKVVRVIVPFPPGAGVDIVTRIVVPRVAESLGQSFVVDNRGGAGGIVGTEIAAKAPADGYNLYVGGTALVVTPLMGKVPYAARDFAPISRMAQVPFVLVVHPTMPVKSLRDLIVLARAKPGAINYASTGNGTTPHLTTELFRQVAKIDITHVPYKGSSPALTDLLGGHVDMFFCNMLSATPHVTSGRLRALAVSSLKRSPIAPQVPTVAESGFPNFETVTWFGIMAPAGVPEHVVTKLHSEVVKALRRTDVQAELAGQGASPMIDKGPDEMASYIKAETEKWGKVLGSLGLRAQ